VLGLLVITPLPAALTYEDTPNVHRAIMMILPYVLISGLGLGYIYEFLQNRKVAKVIFVSVFLGLLSVESVYFYHQYSYHAPAYKSLYRNDGETEMIKYVITHRKSYDKVIMPMYSEHPLYYLFYTNQFKNINPGQIAYGLEINNIDNISFVKADCPSIQFVANPKEKVLLIDGGDCKSKNALLVKSIQRRDSTFAYKILEPVESPIEDGPLK
jgi:hypothetical protein